MRMLGSLIFVGGAALLSGCAATTPSELTDARRAYLHASEGPAARLAPADLRTAEEALARAETSFSKDAESYQTRDLAYVAQRKAEMADAQASIVMEQESKTRADKDYQVTQGKLLKEKTEDLSQTRTALAISEHSEQATADKLTAEQRARLAAEKTTTQQSTMLQQKTQDLSQTRMALAISEHSEQATADKLSAEQQARLAAEKTTTTQSALLQEKTEDLSQTRTALAVSERSGQATAEQLIAEQKAHLEASKKATEAQAALAKLAAIKEDERGMVITLSGSVLFRSDEAILMPGAESRLDQVVDALAASDRNVMVEGYTDSQGADQYNLDLSQRRAEAVRDYLVRRGYDASRVQARGIGEARPIADNATSEGRANNRRVEIVLEREAKR